jgi:hypothetical protein
VYLTGNPLGDDIQRIAKFAQHEKSFEQVFDVGVRIGFWVASSRRHGGARFGFRPRRRDR